MDSSMFYQPAAKWQVGAAFCAAVLVHVAAVGLADRSSAAAAADVIEVSPDVVIVPLIDDPRPVDRRDPPPDVAPPSVPTPESAFFEVQPQVEPVRQRFNRPPQRPVWAAAAPTRMQMAAAKVLAIHAPRPEYPYEARRHARSDQVWPLLTVDPINGAVIDVQMVRSIGNVFLDNAAISGFMRWRFKPGTVSQVQTPITYTLTGASY